MIGKTLSHYRLVEQIGAGGMGVIYRARDERLERDVALKVLHEAALADDEARKRFRKEALALSKLNHPNIATIFDFDHEEGVDFLVMEFVEGESLTARLGRGPLPEKEVASLGGQVAAALEEAHERRVIHRDLKPGNVLVTPKGQAKVLDFGLAKLLRPFADDGVTRSESGSRTFSGTLPYMAPEQLRKETLDVRTDIHSLGALLYEMATGQRVFRDVSSPRLTDAILHHLPVPPRAVNSRISTEMERIILKCLEKEPENRYQTAKEVTVDLRRSITPSSTARATPAVSANSTWRKVAWVAAIALLVVAGLVLGKNMGWLRFGPPGSPRIEAIAVLPLDNLSRDSEQEYFADGMTEALISSLAQIRALRVISRTSVMQYKGTRKLLPQIAKELGVDAVVEGSVQRSGNRVKISAQLIAAASDTHLWAKEYERDVGEVLALQSDVARAIADEIKITLTPREEKQLAHPAAVNPEAYQAYLKGRHFLNQRDLRRLPRAIEHLEQAIQRDPQYALAYVALADVYNLLGFYSALPPNTAYPKAKAAALKALEINEALSEAHTALADVRLHFDLDWHGAEQGFRRAIELNPNDSSAHHLYAVYLSLLGRTAESRKEINRALELDPVSVSINADMALHLLYAGKSDEAITQGHKSLEIDPNSHLAHFWLARAYLQKKMFAEAIREFRKAVDLQPGNLMALAVLGNVYAVSGQQTEARTTLGELQKLSQQRYIAPSYSALVYAGLGEKSKFFEWGERAFQAHDPLITRLKADPILDSLRDDPRFQELVRRMKFPESGER